MSNFLSDTWSTLKGIAKHPIDEGQFMFDVARGKTDLKDAPGKHQDMMHKNITSPLLGDSKLAKNSDAVAGAIVGGVLAAPLLGAGAGGSGGGFSLGNVTNYFTPGKAGNAWSGLWDSAAGPSDDVLGMMADNEADGAVGTGKEALKKAKGDLGNKMDFAKMSQVLKSVQGSPESNVPQAQARAGGFKGVDKSLYGNPLADREFQQMYSQPLQSKLY